MAFNIRLGLPEMEVLWNDLSSRKKQGKLARDEEKFFKKCWVIWLQIPGTRAWPLMRLTI
jgi:hypothetical protein